MTVRSLGDLAESFDRTATSARVMGRRHVLGNLIWPSSSADLLLRRVAVALVFLLGVAELKVPVQSLVVPYVYLKDFLQEWLLARAFVEGVDPYLPIPELADRFLGPLPVHLIFPHPTPHPPTAGLLFLPIGFLSYPSAAALWVVLELICLVASVYLLGRIGNLRLGWGMMLVISATSLVWYPVVLDLALGQLMLPLLLLLSGAYYALLSGQRAAGGALLGISLLVKPIAWPVLLVFLVRREWRSLVAVLSTVLLGYGVAAWAIGANVVLVYLTQVLPTVTRFYQANPYNISAWTVGWRLFDGTDAGILPGISAPPLVQSAPAAAVVSALLPALILLASLVTVWRQRSEARSLGLMICVSIMVSPISWNHYLLLTAIPAVEAGIWLIQHHLPSRATNLGLLVGMLLLTGDEWTTLVLALVGKAIVPGGTVFVPFAPALLTLGPTVAVAALALLLVKLPDLPGRTLEYRTSSACGGR